MPVPSRGAFLPVVPDSVRFRPTQRKQPDILLVKSLCLVHVALTVATWFSVPHAEPALACQPEACALLLAS